MQEARNRNLLFVSHEASRTGAPIALLHMLRWLKRETDWRIHVVLLAGGALEGDFREVGETHLWELKPGPNAWPQRWQRIKRLAGIPDIRKQRILARLRKINPAIIYANSVVSLPLGVELKQVLTAAKLVAHIHELNVLLGRYLTPAAFMELARQVDFFVTVSQAAKDNLVQYYSIAAERIQILYSYIEVLEPAYYEEQGRKLRASLGIASDAFVVLSAGSLQWNKSPDLFIQVAQQVSLLTKAMPVFIWLGGSMQSPIGRELEHDLTRVGLADQVRFISAKSNPQDYMSMCDVFMLPSREDSFGLVGLEAASLGKPVLCFAGGGGMQEFVEQDAGIIVPYLRIELMAQAIMSLQQNPAHRVALGKQAAEKLRKRHVSSVVLPQVDRLLQELTGTGTK